jgi:nicotinate-nucleotide adenylyltransferase
MNTGLFFGSFNPIHIGHLALANYMLEFTPMQHVWFVVSPQNPFKAQAGLLPEYQRLHLVNIAIADFPAFKASSIEFNLPRPSYTIDTLAYLEEKYAGEDFSIIMGADGLPGFHKWKNFRVLLERYDLWIYPRPGFSGQNALNPNIPDWSRIHFSEAPIMDISSSFIREGIRNGHKLDCFMPHEVARYVDEMNFFKK